MAVAAHPLRVVEPQARVLEAAWRRSATIAGWRPCTNSSHCRTSSGLPRKSGVRSCSFSGTMSMILRSPLLAAPPAHSAMNASGAASYSTRSLPFGFVRSPG